MLRGSFCILLSVAALAPLARQLYRRDVVTPAVLAAARSGIVLPDNCAPEPAERATYMLGSLLVPALIFGWTLALPWAARRWPKVARWQAPARVNTALEILLLAGAFVYLWLALRGDQFMAVSYNALAQRPLLSVPAALAALGVTWWLNSSSGAALWITRWIGWLALALPTLAIVLSSTIGPHNDYAQHFHFYAIFDPQVQVHLGRNLLVDYQSQYGLYPDLLEPVFAVTGLSVFKFALVMSLLTAVSFGLIAWILWTVVSRRGLAVAGYLGLLFNCWLQFELRTDVSGKHAFDLYFQYIPLRLIVPAMGLAFVWAYHARPTRRQYWTALVCLSLGVLWNLDSGAVTLVTWLAALVYESLFFDGWPTRLRRIGAHVASTAGVLAATLLAYSAIKFAWYGAWPDLWQVIEYQRLFYGAGFNMLPMPWWGAWQLAIAMYLIGFAITAAALNKGVRTPRDTLIFAACVLGLGLFAYYQGRSHIMCLLLCWWPAMFLLPIYCDRLWDTIKLAPRREWLAQGLARGLAWTAGLFIVGSAASLATNARQWYTVASAQLAAAATPGSPLADDVATLGKGIGPSDQVLVLSGYSPSLHLALDHGTPASAALNQMLWISQWRELADAVLRRPGTRVFFDRTFSQDIVIGPIRNLGCREFLAAVTPHLRLLAETPHGRVYELSGSDTAVGDARAGGAVRR